MCIHMNWRHIINQSRGETKEIEERIGEEEKQQQAKKIRIIYYHFDQKSDIFLRIQSLYNRHKSHD